MKRRTFISLLGGAVAFPLAAGAQQARPPAIGVLTFGNPEPSVSLLRDGLRELGYVDGQTMQFLPRNAEGSSARLAELAAELVRLKVDIIVGIQTPAVQAAKKATSEIPIVMATAGDPVGTGLVASLARPGGNITGLSGTTSELGAKSLELIREVAPAAKRVAVLANLTDPFTKPFLEQIEAAGPRMGMAIRPLMLRAADDFGPAFAAANREPAQALIVQPSLPRSKAIELMLKHRLPAISPTGLFAADGGLISYSASPLWVREGASYVDKILKGAKPADLPVQQPTRFELVLNLKTAQALDLTIPPTLLARADRVIE
jgi:putative tryptophan/tyrosine transport system substrate-binding protein